MDVEHRQLVQLLPLLPLLAELGRTEHITETAELLGLPQSTVSRAIAADAAISSRTSPARGRRESRTRHSGPPSTRTGSSA